MAMIAGGDAVDPGAADAEVASAADGGVAASVADGAAAPADGDACGASSFERLRLHRSLGGVRGRWRGGGVGPVHLNIAGLDSKSCRSRAAGQHQTNRQELATRIRNSTS